MLSFPEVFVSSRPASDQTEKKGFDRRKNSISLFFVQSPDFFPECADFPLPGVVKSDTNST